MNTFATAIDQSQMTRTENGMLTNATSGEALTELFFKAGGMRGQDIVPLFVKAYVADRDVALRIAQYIRDVRGGMGERTHFKNILKYLEVNCPADAELLMHKIPEIGRFDDLFTFTGAMKSKAFTLYGDHLRAGNGLAAKWCPREKSSQKKLAKEFMEFFGLTPKQYRKLLASFTTVVESDMCSGQWDTINFSHVPSLAHSRYKKAFTRNTTKYAEYVAALTKGDPSVKINAAAVYPYDVLKGRISNYGGISWNATELAAIEAQWNALPNFIEGANILPMVDVSGSMTCSAGTTGSTSCLDVAVSLGLYFADKNTGKFKDCFLTFSGNPELMVLKGSINQKIDQMVRSNWDMNTDLHKAFDKILSTATAGNVPQAEMPETLVIFSDMQFDQCVRFDDTAMQMIQRKYEAAGYTVPRIVFWNLNSKNGTPVKFNQVGAALVSGFSPAVTKAILSGSEEFTPFSIMMEAVGVDRYKL